MIQGCAGRARIRAGAVLHYLSRRPGQRQEFLRSMIDPAPGGRYALTERERVDALRADAMLDRLGVRCLWRSAIVVEQLRTRGIAANIVITVSASDPRRAHADCEVGGVPLRSREPDSVRLR